MPTSTVWRLTLAAAAAVVVAVVAPPPLALDIPLPATVSDQVGSASVPANAGHTAAAARTFKPAGRRWG